MVYLMPWKKESTVEILGKQLEKPEPWAGVGAAGRLSFLFVDFFFQAGWQSPSPFLEILRNPLYNASFFGGTELSYLPEAPPGTRNSVSICFVVCLYFQHLNSLKFTNSIVLDYFVFLRSYKFLSVKPKLPVPFYLTKISQ